jgi:hypothetical protein
MKNNMSKISNVVKAGLATVALTLANFASAQTTDVASTTTPGVPTTGLAGMSILNTSLLILAAVLVVIGLVSLLNSKQYSL